MATRRIHVTGQLFSIKQRSSVETPRLLSILATMVNGQKQEPKEPPSTPTKRPRNPASSPLTSPRKRYATDRYIPDRHEGADMASVFLLGEEGLGSPVKFRPKKTSTETDVQKEDASRLYSKVLKTELFGADMASASSSQQPKTALVQTPPIHKSPRVLKLTSPMTTGKMYRRIDFGLTLDPKDSRFSTSPITPASQVALQSPRKPPRYIAKVPFKVLDAPELADDFYLNLVDWGASNFLAVGLGTCVYLWNAHTSRVTKLCDIGPYDAVTSVSWMQRGTHLAVGTNRGLVQLWDVEKLIKTRTMTGHASRVGTLAWFDSTLSSGSRDRNVFHRDIRSPEQYYKKLNGHRQEVCGLKWNNEGSQLASGGNDNKLLVWDRLGEEPLHTFSEHTAAVKAIAWSPHQHGLLVSGGGTADRKIRFWNTLGGNPLQCVDTGSQVCNINWSRTANEFVSTHGYSQNQIIVWKYPSMQQLATLTGHTYRVLYLATSPDNQTIVTGAGDETLRFWNVFSKGRERDQSRGILSVNASSLR